MYGSSSNYPNDKNDKKFICFYFFFKKLKSICKFFFNYILKKEVYLDRFNECYKNVIVIIDKEKYNVDLEIDGGINFQNSKTAKEAGANILVSGSTIFKENSGDLKKNINLLREN